VNRHRLRVPLLMPGSCSISFAAASSRAAWRSVLRLSRAAWHSVPLLMVRHPSASAGNVSSATSSRTWRAGAPSGSSARIASAP
jgi:hypothetical protein